jgi:hypothetical protein
MSPEDPKILSIAFHEAAHECVSDYFGLEATGFVGGTSQGVCLHKSGGSFKDAVVAFAGVLAEDVLNLRHRSRTLPSVPLPLTAENLDKWVSQMLHEGGLDEMSRTDRNAIVFCPEQEQREAAEQAFKILSDNMKLLRLTARAMAQQHCASGSGEDDEENIRTFLQQKREKAIEAKQAVNVAELLAKMDVPVPRLPATADQFIKLIVAKNKTVTTELVEKARAFARELRRSGGHADFLSTTFYSEGEWRYAAVRFQDWEKNQTKETTA